MKINHITITTGNNEATSRADVRDDTLAVLAPWIFEIVDTNQTHPLPVPPLAHYGAKALAQDGGLLVTVFGPSGPYEPGKPGRSDVPLVTFGVMQHDSQGTALWNAMIRQFGSAPGITQPTAPWCAVIVHPSSMMHFSAFEWLGDFERCCAWAWITRNPRLT